MNRLVKRILKEEDALNSGTGRSMKSKAEESISNTLNRFLQQSVSFVGREETVNLLENVISKLMDYENKNIGSDYNVNFDWIQDVVRGMGDPDEILVRKNREKDDFDLEQRGYTKNKY